MITEFGFDPLKYNVPIPRANTTGHDKKRYLPT